MLGTRTRRSGSGAAARPSRKATPASPKDSVSAMMCACDTATKSAASKNSPTAFWLAKLEAADIPCGPVNPLAELPADTQLAAVDFFPLAEHPSEGSIRMVRPPVRFGDADCALRHPAPRLGEHSRTILREAGFAESEIEDLFVRKVAIEAAAD